MLVLEQNYSKGYEYSIFAFEAMLNFDAKVVYIQEPFLEI